MHNDLTNLLPPERQQQLSREYWLRMGVIASTGCTALVLVAIALLLPTYVLLSGSAEAKKSTLAHLEASPRSGDSETLVRLDTLTKNTETLASLARQPSTTEIIRSILSLSRAGVVITSVVYVPAVGDTPSVVSVSGVAATRDALRNYQVALQGAPHVHSADLPVSAYAKDANIPFTVSIILAP